MQVIRRAWTPAVGPLGELAAAAAGRAEAALAGRGAELERAARRAQPATPFLPALRSDFVSVIAELKRSSPSKGAINSTMDAGRQAAAYAAGGAAALSVLTEPTRFGGRTADLADAAASTAVPLLKKDFHVDPLQILEARALGASAVLLIARALGDDALAALAALAFDVGIEPLVEIRDERELEAALAAGARAIGVNNRDLETLAIDRRTGDRLLPLIPADCVAIAESGVRDAADVAAAARAGADAVLVGSSVSAAADPAHAVRELATVPRRGRHRAV